MRLAPLRAWSSTKLRAACQRCASRRARRARRRSTCLRSKLRRCAGWGRGGSFLAGESVDADDDGFSGIDGALVVVGGVLDLLLHPAALDGAEHAAEGFDAVE